MIRLEWVDNKFIAEANIQLNQLSVLHKYALINNKPAITGFLKACNFELIGYELREDIFFIEKQKGIFISIANEGSGFNILFNLLGYIFVGQDIEVVEDSIKYDLHPLLLECVKKYISRCNNKHIAFI